MFLLWIVGAVVALLVASFLAALIVGHFAAAGWVPDDEPEWVPPDETGHPVA
jgi:hypothetical protein